MSAITKHTKSYRLRVQADSIAAAMPPLLVAARHIAAAINLGSHGRRRAGPGDSFWQFRPYSKDDTPQAIDWRQSGKFDTVFVREREWVAAQTAALWCDTSPSMRYRSAKTLPTKAERSAVMLLALAELLVDGGERIIRLDSDGRPQRTVRAGRLAVAHMADTVVTELMTEDTRQNIPPLPRFTAALPRHAAVVLFSDFLAPLDVISESVHTLMRQGVTGHMVQVLDPAEESLPFTGRVRFVGLEQEGSTIIDRAEEARDNYTRKLNEHCEGLKFLAMQAGWSFGTHRTDHSPQLTMAALHNAITGYRH
jgi:uncharacterized protein (DUF58 family)